MQAPMTVLYRYNVHVRDVPGTSMYARSAAGACATLGSFEVPEICQIPNSLER